MPSMFMANMRTTGCYRNNIENNMSAIEKIGGKKKRKKNTECLEIVFTKVLQGDALQPPSPRLIYNHKNATMKCQLRNLNSAHAKL